MPNYLADQTSPYLLQHANNPVHWYPWSQVALDIAKQKNKPILLSIGYSACHWCHVMEKESFQSDSIANIMNNNFVCIKVDREERPDLDKIYQSAHQILTQRPGGWPLTLALTPQGHAPFFAGTYFPPEPRFNLPGFSELLEKISSHFEKNREQMENYHHSFGEALSQLNPKISNSELPTPELVLSSAAEQLENQFDNEFGGFGDAPKFPHPCQLSLLLSHYHAQNQQDENEDTSLSMAKKTMTRMARGGLYDQIGGGFFRYAVDKEWRIPHFEKMLYDNAQLLGLYCDLYQTTKDQEYADIVAGVAQWTMSEMQQSGGGYASTLDADSEGAEGKYYTWSETDLRVLLSQQEYGAIEHYFALYGDANFDGYWHLNINPELDRKLLLQTPELNKLIEAAKTKLLVHRQTRVPPALDDKILTAWNGLMIKGMAKAGRILGRPEFIESAQRSVNFIRNNLWQNRRLLATCREGTAHLNGYLDDYAFMLEAIVELLQYRWSSTNLEFATMIANALLDNFEDTESGGFFFTSHDHESLLHRSKSGADDAIPSGNGSAVGALLKLGQLTGNTHFISSADRALRLFATEIAKSPSIYGSLSLSFQWTQSNHQTIIIRGEETDALSWQTVINQNSIANNCNIYVIANDAQGLPPTLAAKKSNGKTIAYVCHGLSCSDPIDNIGKLDALITSGN
ncbi:MAG: DUF255 domain-containing protein [Gammaproteobacteria bacterium]|nr:DUF255 domain-containing protein [Gammaproteobacteria bacterium]